MKIEEELLQEKIKANVKREMKKRLISQREMAANVGSSYTAFRNKLGKNKKGSRRLTVYELVIIADELMLPLEELLKG